MEVIVTDNGTSELSSNSIRNCFPSFHSIALGKIMNLLLPSATGKIQKQLGLSNLVESISNSLLYLSQEVKKIDGLVIKEAVKSYPQARTGKDKAN